MSNYDGIVSLMSNCDSCEVLNCYKSELATHKEEAQALTDLIAGVAGMIQDSREDRLRLATEIVENSVETALERRSETGRPYITRLLNERPGLAKRYFKALDSYANIIDKEETFLAKGEADCSGPNSRKRFYLVGKQVMHCSSKSWVFQMRQLGIK